MHLHVPVSHLSQSWGTQMIPIVVLGTCICDLNGSTFCIIPFSTPGGWNEKQVSLNILLLKTTSLTYTLRSSAPSTGRSKNNRRRWVFWHFAIFCFWVDDRSGSKIYSSLIMDLWTNTLYVAYQNTTTGWGVAMLSRYTDPPASPVGCCCLPNLQCCRRTRCEHSGCLPLLAGTFWRGWPSASSLQSSPDSGAWTHSLSNVSFNWWSSIRSCSYLFIFSHFNLRINIWCLGGKKS